MARQGLGKSRAKRMLSMVDDALKLPCDSEYEKTREITISTSVEEKCGEEEENLTGTYSPPLQCLSPNFDLRSQLLQSPSTISYESAIFDNVDFVASPSLIFNTPRHRQRKIEQNVVTQSIESYNLSTSMDLTTLSDTTMQVLVAETCDPITPLEENIQYTTLETVREDCIINQHITTYTTPVDSDNANIPILQYKETNGDSNDCNSADLHADFLVGNQSEMTENEGVVPNDCNNAIISDPDVLVETQYTTIENHDEDFNVCNQNVSDILSATKKLTRKRMRHETDWTKVRNKKLKNSGQEHTSTANKKVEAKKIKDTCKCNNKCGEKISQVKRQDIFDEFWRLGDHEDQWHYILRHVNTQDIKKMQLVRNKNRTQTISYYFKLDKSEKIFVCKKIFLSTLSITEKTVYTAIEKGKSAEIKDNRGQHENRPRKMSMLTEQSVIAHINLFPVKESHYVRSDTKKLYLEETLNISKMYRIYSDEWFNCQNYTDNVKMATKRQYETVFNTKFNYSFHKPKKDMCGKCTLFRQADGKRKVQLQEAYTKHIRNKECVRELKANDKTKVDPTTTVVAIYDLEKVLTIPQSEVGIFHYKRKYPIYNFTIYNSINRKGYCYLWHYQLAKRGANEVGSCVLDFIENETQRGIQNFIFYSDGCAGQNKNRIIFGLYLYLAKKYGVNIIHRFFETGHSQSEGDSMHSLIERAKKNHTIYTPDQMYGIIMNAKINGKKFHLKEMEQTDFFDLKEVMDKRYWLRVDQTNEKIMWTKIHEVKIAQTHPDVVYFKYNFDDQYISLNTAPNIRPSRGRQKKVTTDVSEDVLKILYREPIALPKPLYDDLMSLCKTEAIPKHYHNFYNNLRCVGIGNSEEEINIETEDSN